MHFCYQGTMNSIWLDGSHPIENGEIKEMTARVKYEQNCNSRYTWKVKVKKCSRVKENYFVYLLTPAPRCPMVYCAGLWNKCQYYIHWCMLYDAISLCTSVQEIAGSISTYFVAHLRVWNTGIPYKNTVWHRHCSRYLELLMAWN